MPHEKILVVDDERSILELLQYNLEKNGYRVDAVETGEEAIASVKASIPDLIVLDLMLPGIDGLEVCKILKNNSRTSHIPILMLTAKGEDTDIVSGLELGADDYVTKPFSVSVLVARIRAVLRSKSPKTTTGAITIDELTINPDKHEVTFAGKLIELTHAEFALLHLLAAHRGRVFTRKQVIDALWGDEKVVTERSVDVQIVGLRKKLGPAARDIQTVRGIGYKFRDR
jgi:two-component system phosphate regulon response regulator PhoB